MARKLAFRGVLVALVVVALGCKVEVTPSSSKGWFFVNEGAHGTGRYINGPGTPPSGRGSALLTVDGTGREDIATVNYQGHPLAAITNLQYSTYQAFSGSSQDTPTLEFDVDYDSTDSTTAYQGRLVYVPSIAAPVVPGTWQTWDTMTGTGAWYSSGSGASSYRPIVGGAIQSSPPCNQASFCTWATLMADYPHAQIRPTTGLFMVRVGGPTGGASEATDAVTIGFSGVDSIYDFEPGDSPVVVNATTAPGLDFAFAQETATGSGAFVSGPTGADGTGSAQLTVDATGGEGISTGMYAGTPISNLSALSYNTYVQTVGSANAPTLQFDTDYDSTDANTGFQGRLVFEPSLSGTAVTPSAWQTWSPLSATSGWWQTGDAIVGGIDVGKPCTQATPCSWSTIESLYSNAQIRGIVGQVAGIPNAGRLWLKAGGGWAPGFTGNVDDLIVGVNGTSVTYNFEG